MDKRHFPFLLIALALAVSLGFVAGGAHLAERAAAPIQVRAEALGFIPLRLDRARIAAPEVRVPGIIAPRPVLEPASISPLPAVVTTAASLAAPAVPDAAPPEPRAVEDAPSPASRMAPQRSLKPPVTGALQPALASRPVPATRALQPDARLPFHEGGASNFAAAANEGPSQAPTDRH